MRILLSLIISFLPFLMLSQSFTVKGNTYKTVKTKRSKGINTNFNYEDKEGKLHPIFITEKGRAYIIKISKKTGKEYRQYLSEDISKDICNKTNKQYSPKTKK